MFSFLLFCFLPKFSHFLLEGIKKNMIQCPKKVIELCPLFNFSIIFIRRLQLKSTESIGMCSQIPIRVTYIMHCTYKRNWAFVAIQIFSQSSYPEYNLCCHTNIRDQLVFGPYHLSSVVWLWLPSNSKVMLKLKCKRILKIKQKLFDSYNLFLKGSTTFFFFLSKLYGNAKKT